MDWRHCANVPVHGYVFLLSMYVSLSLLECVSEAFFFLRASAELFCLAGLLLSPGIYCFHNFQVWMLCIKLWIAETTLQVFLTVKHTNVTHFCVAWSPVHQSLIEDTWYKHKIVQILAEIVVIIIFDWVLHFDTVPDRLASGRAQ